MVGCSVSKPITMCTVGMAPTRVLGRLLTDHWIGSWVSRMALRYGWKGPEQSLWAVSGSTDMIQVCRPSSDYKGNNNKNKQMELNQGKKLLHSKASH